MEFVTSMTPIAGAAAHFAGETFSSFLARRSYESEMSHGRGEYSNMGSRMYESSSDRGKYGYSGAARGMSHARGGGNSYPAAPGYSDSEFSGGRGGSSRESYRRGR
uniref:Uncharacterized protein n=1 Tax=Panagrolaimus superbus TaxID=310955 RepID=A0A914YFJ4_9BILA